MIDTKADASLTITDGLSTALDDGKNNKLKNIIKNGNKYTKKDTQLISQQGGLCY